MKNVIARVAKKTGDVFGVNEIRDDLQKNYTALLNNQKKIDELFSYINSVENDFKKEIEEIKRENFYLKNIIQVTNDISTTSYKGGINEVIRKGNLKLLKTVVSIFKKNGIKYFLNYGTLLGAIRHHGFIPWDDDIDISVMRKDYNRINDDLLQSFLDAGLKVVRGEIIRIYYKDTPLQIDIFPFDFYNKDIRDESEKRALEKKMSEIRNKCIKYDYDGLYSQTTTIVSPDYADIERIRVTEFCKNVDFETAQKNHFSIYSGFENHGGCYKFFDFDWIFPLKRKKFMGEEFCIPNKSDVLLWYLYGNNYWDFPSNFDIHQDILARINAGTIERMQEFIEEEGNGKI